MEKTTLIITDLDGNSVMGILTLFGKDKNQFADLVNTVKWDYPGEWTWGDVLSRMMSEKWNFDWSDNFSEFGV